MHRFHLPPEHCQGGEILLTGREAHHATHVLRLRQGQRIVVFDGVGREYHGEVSECQRPTLRIRITQEVVVPPPASRLTLLQAMPKGKLFDDILQKAVELGVWRIIPLLSERVLTRLDSVRAEPKLDHWRMVAVEAAKQCGSAWLPQIEAPVRPADFLARGERFDVALIASLHPGGLHPRAPLAAFRQAHHTFPATLAVWVGPEGDFSPAEVEAARAAGAQPITLGPLILRVETAAVYCLSVLNYELQASAQPKVRADRRRTAT